MLRLASRIFGEPPCLPLPPSGSRFTRSSTTAIGFRGAIFGEFVVTERPATPHVGSPLPVQRLGVTDMHVTRVGFGAWAIGGADWVAGWGRQDDSASIASIRHAIDRGINWIDTAAVYGLGHSEEIVGQALAEMPASERPFVFTKCGLIWDETDRMVMPKKIGTSASIRDEVVASLRRLRTERIDLYQMH